MPWDPRWNFPDVPQAPNLHIVTPSLKGIQCLYLLSNWPFNVLPFLFLNSTSIILISDLEKQKWHLLGAVLPATNPWRQLLLSLALLQVMD